MDKGKQDIAMFVAFWLNGYVLRQEWEPNLS